MVELHRILAPDALLLASFIGEGTGVAEAAGWEEDRIGMNVLDGGLSYDQGGATCCTPAGGYVRIGGARSRSSRSNPTSLGTRLGS
jgi:hypothetical protein